jgi:cytochrome c
MKGDLVGPSFMDIATKYQDNPDAMTILSNSVLNGCMGKWPKGHHVQSMPPQRQVPKEDMSEIIKWTLSLKRTQWN